MATMRLPAHVIKVKLSLRAKVAVGDVTVALRSVTRWIAWLHRSHALSATVALASRVQSLFPVHPISRVPPVHNIGSQMTLGLRLLRKPDKWLCFVCFLQHCEPPCTEVFPRHGCLVARGSYEYRLNFLWSCIVASVCSGCNVEVSCAGKPPWSGVHETALLVGGGESHLSRPRVELLREGIWCRCLGQNSAMQLVFVFNLNKRAAVLYHGHFLLKFQTTLQMVRKAGTLLSIPHEFFSLYFYKCARFFFFFSSNACLFNEC